MDEPDCRRHRVVGYGVSPDPQRPGWVDRRVLRTACRRNIANIGWRACRDKTVAPCPGCYAT